MSQSEIIRPDILGLEKTDFSFLDLPENSNLIKAGLSDITKLQIVDQLDKGFFPNLG